MYYKNTKFNYGADNFQKLESFCVWAGTQVEEQKYRCFNLVS